MVEVLRWVLGVPRCLAILYTKGFTEPPHHQQHLLSIHDLLATVSGPAACIFQIAENPETHEETALVQNRVVGGHASLHRGDNRMRNYS